MRTMKWFIGAVLFVFFVWLLLMNNVTISLDYGFGTVRVSLLLTLLIAYLMGAVSGTTPLLLYCIRYLRKQKTETKDG
jgi:uncharacterized integral membrane protein